MAKITNDNGPSNAVTGEGMPAPDQPAEQGHVQAHGPAELNGAPAPDDGAITETATFDPSEHTADEVAAYLSDRRAAGQHDEARRVADAERQGKNRSTALKGEA
jgi:hypothetical protein